MPPKKEHRFTDGIEEKHCGACEKWKPLSSFCNVKTFSDGLNNRCRKCDSKSKLAAYRRNPKSQRERSHRYEQSHSDKVRKSRSAWWGSNPDKAREYRKRDIESGNMNLRTLRRMARKKSLPDTFTPDEQALTVAFFGGCALTESQEYHWDHFIPLITGRGGTCSGNMIPLRQDLNYSKHGRNPFDWFEANRRRFELLDHKFDAIVNYLAELNGMTAEEYRAYVYSCFEIKPEEELS